MIDTSIFTKPVLTNLKNTYEEIKKSKLDVKFTDGSGEHFIFWDKQNQRFMIHTDTEDPKCPNIVALEHEISHYLHDSPLKSLRDCIKQLRSDSGIQKLIDDADPKISKSKLENFADALIKNSFNVLEDCRIENLTGMIQRGSEIRFVDNCHDLGQMDDIIKPMMNKDPVNGLLALRFFREDIAIIHGMEHYKKYFDMIRATTAKGAIMVIREFAKEELKPWIQSKLNEPIPDPEDEDNQSQEQQDGEGSDGEGDAGEQQDGEGSDSEQQDGEGADGEGADGEGADGEGADGAEKINEDEDAKKGGSDGADPQTADSEEDEDDADQPKKTADPKDQTNKSIDQLIIDWGTQEGKDKTHQEGGFEESNKIRLGNSDTTQDLESFLEGEAKKQVKIVEKMQEELTGFKSKPTINKNYEKGKAQMKGKYRTEIVMSADRRDSEHDQGFVNSIEKTLREIKTKKSIEYHKRGHLNTGRFIQTRYSSKPKYYEQTKTNNKKLVIDLMIDKSGSMGSYELRTCQIIADSFLRATEHQKQIEINVMGWTSGHAGLVITKNRDPKNNGHILGADAGGTPTDWALDWYDEYTQQSKNKHLLIFMTDGLADTSITGMTDTDGSHAIGNQRISQLTLYGKAIMDAIRKRKHAVFGIIVGDTNQINENFIQNIFGKDGACVDDFEEAREHVEKQFRNSVEDFVKSL